jgi:hypothetical protein
MMQFLVISRIIVKISADSSSVLVPRQGGASPGGPGMALQL